MKFQISNMKFASLIFLTLLCVHEQQAAGQVPLNIGITILKAEDARRYDATLEDLMKSPNADIRKRATLGAGRIGNEAAIPALAYLLGNDASGEVRAMAAFALGEIESIKAADSILRALRAETRPLGSVPPREPGGTLI